MDESTLRAFEASLERCSVQPRFMDIFYDQFIDSSPKVRAKFAGTDLIRQKQMVWASLALLLEGARQEGGRPPEHLGALARRHGAQGLAVGAELYDLWLDSLLAAVRQCDPAWCLAVEAAWERVMGWGIHFLCSHYHDGGAS